MLKSHNSALLIIIRPLLLAYLRQLLTDISIRTFAAATDLTFALAVLADLESQPTSGTRRDKTGFSLGISPARCHNFTNRQSNFLKLAHAHQSSQSCEDPASRLHRQSYVFTLVPSHLMFVLCPHRNASIAAPCQWRCPCDSSGLRARGLKTSACNDDDTQFRSRPTLIHGVQHFPYWHDVQFNSRILRCQPKRNISLVRLQTWDRFCFELPIHRAISHPFPSPLPCTLPPTALFLQAQHSSTPCRPAFPIA